jgi:hypothetical protein
MSTTQHSLDTRTRYARWVWAFTGTLHDTRCVVLDLDFLHNDHNITIGHLHDSCSCGAFERDATLRQRLLYPPSIQQQQLALRKRSITRRRGNVLSIAAYRKLKG